MRDPATGRVVEIPLEQIEQAVRAGYEFDTPAAELGRISADVAAQETEGLGAGVEALAAGALRGATFGTSDVAAAALGTEDTVQRLAALRRNRPVASLVGEIGGGVGAALATGGTGTVGALARLTPAGAATQLGARVAGAGEGVLGGIAAGTAAGALEGALAGGGNYLTEVALEDKPLSAEGFLAGASRGALWGGAAGGALATGAQAFTKARSLFPKATATRETVEAAENAAVDEIDAAVRDSDALAAEARRRVGEITALRRAEDPAVDAAIRQAETTLPRPEPVPAAPPPTSATGAAAPEPTRLLDDDEIGMLISGRGRLRGGKVRAVKEAAEEVAPPPAAAPEVDLEATLRATLEGSGTPRAPRTGAMDPEQARRVAMRERAKETLEAARRQREGLPPVEAAPPVAPAPPAAAAAPASFEQRFQDAFDTLDAQSGGNNYVLIGDLRRALPDMPRKDFDDALYNLRKERVWSMDSADGRHVKLPAEQIEAGIREAGSNLVYVQRGPKWRSPAAAPVAPAAPAVAQSGPVSSVDDFVDRLRDAMEGIPIGRTSTGSGVDEFFGDRKIFIHALRDRMGMDLDEFSRWATKAHREGKIEMSRMDLMPALNRQTQDAVIANEVTGGNARYHAIAPLPPRTRPPAAPTGRVARAAGTGGRLEITDLAAERAPKIGEDLTAITGRPTTLEQLAGAYRMPDGWGLKVDNAGTAAGARGGINMQADIIAPDGNVAGFLARTIRRGDDGAVEILHNDFQLYPGYWNHGVGPVVSKAALEAYPAMGIQRIEIPSATHIGRYYWMKQGYQVARDDVDTIVEQFGKWLAKDADLAPNAKKIMATARRELKKPGGITNMAVGDRKIGKEFLLDEDAPSYSLTLKLKKGDRFYEAVKRSLGIDQPAPAAAAPSRLERELAGTLESVRGGAPLGAAPHVARRQVLDQIDEIVARLDPEAKVLVDAARELDMTAGQVRQWVEEMRRRGGARTLSAAPRRNILDRTEPAVAAPTPATVAAEAAPAPAAEDAGEAVRQALRIPAREKDDAVRDIAETLGRFEAANANAADALGPRAPATAAARGAALREAEAKVTSAQGRQVAEGAAKVERAAAANPGALSGVADLGTAYEVMRAFGVPLPSIGRIPVIGPLLRAYLLARAGSTVFRRLGGRVPVTAEAFIAKGAAATRERVYRAVDSMLEVAPKVTRKAQALGVPKWTAVLATKLFDDGERREEGKTDAELVRNRVDELARAARPGAVEAVIAERFPMADPALTDELAATMKRRLDYLRANAPLQPTAPTILGGGRSGWEPSKAQITDFARRMEAVDDPAAVLERAAQTGDISTQAADAIRAVYPRLFGEAQMRLIQRAAALREALPYARRVMMSTLFDVPLDGTTEPEYVAFLQSAYAPAPQPQGPAMGAPPVPTISADVNAGGRATLRMDAPIR